MYPGEEGGRVGGRPGARRGRLRSAGAWGFLLAFALAGMAADVPPAAPVTAVRPVSATGDRSWPGSAFFAEPRWVRVHIDLPRASEAALRREPREYAEATMTLDGRTLTQVGIKLKGAAGSYRELEDRPALTVSFNRWDKGRRWNGLRRIHLNNSVQDPTLLNEYLAGELFRSVGVPATRVAWARVTLNGRDLGDYVLKEAFEPEFLAGFFRDTRGNLYDGGFLQEITDPLERDQGNGPPDRADLKRLAQAARVRDPAERWRRLQTVLDVERFISYAAVSAMLADWDGYAMNRNNYRIYFNPEDGRAVLLPHGTDQLFQRHTGGLDAEWGGMLAHAVFSVPEGRARYRERFVQIFTNQFRLQGMTNLLDRVGSTLGAVDPEWARRARWSAQSVRNRRRALEDEPDLRALLPDLPKPTPIPREGVRPEEWVVQEQGDAAAEERVVDGVPVLRIEAQGESTASFRARVLLPRGRYRFEGRLRTIRVRGLRDARGEGAGLRISGSPQVRANAMVGDRDWTWVAYDFELAGQGATVVLVAELRAHRGVVEFDRDSLKVVPRKD